ncbi:unnamed protein product, partial [Strongylus vulgaris]
MYETLGFEACVYILNQAEMQIVVCDAVSKAMGLIERKPTCPHLKYLVVMEPITDELRAASEEYGVRVMTMQELEKIGHDAKNRPEHLPPKPEDLATICYTSGTTGTPKGVMLTHANVVADTVCLEFFKHTGFCSAVSCITHALLFRETSVFLLKISKNFDQQLFLLCHVFSIDCMISFYKFSPQVMSEVNKSYVKKALFNIAVAYKAHEMQKLVSILLIDLALSFEKMDSLTILCSRKGDIRLLVEDIKELRPTIVPVVPRVLNRLYDKVMSEVNKSYVKKALFNIAVAYKAHEMQNFIVRKDGFFDNLVFKKVRESRVRLMVTGSAPLSENVLTFVRAAMGCVVVEGYGQTECVACATVSMEGDSNAGHVGMVIPSASIKLVDVPELGYFAKDEAGEICIKGPIVFRGYYQNDELTKEVLDEDGWLHTGDIGRWLKEGTLKIVDRKKHIFKLAQ